MNNTENVLEKLNLLLLGNNESLKMVLKTSLCWSSGSFLDCEDIEEAAWLLSKCSISLSSERDLKIMVVWKRTKERI
jgi:hypothetical protein